ncbi:MAG TPA: 4'-phosphopantetheinyl transferase superfamily protein [Azospirillum sp.]|nr:4'-phosphopantetheinyl transferase superfamily protein [Azospirillum sp.]
MPKDAVQVWTLALEDVGEGDWPALEAVLDDTERARAARFHFERDRLAYVAAHALLRHLLSAFGDREPAAWRFAAGTHGKPHLLDPPAGRDLRFNITHTKGRVAAALAEGVTVGVDVEALDRGRLNLGVADRFFAPVEVAGIHAQPDEAAKAERFLVLWTLKESFIKAIGKGLSQPLSSFGFAELDPPRIRFGDAALGDAARWWFTQWWPGRHVLALAVDWPHAGAPEVVYWELPGAPGKISRK